MQLLLVLMPAWQCPVRAPLLLLLAVFWASCCCLVCHLKGVQPLALPASVLDCACARWAGRCASRQDPQHQNRLHGVLYLTCECSLKIQHGTGAVPSRHFCILSCTGRTAEILEGTLQQAEFDALELAVVWRKLS